MTKTTSEYIAYIYNNTYTRVGFVLLLGLDLVTKYMFRDMGRASNIFTPILNTGISFSIPVYIWRVYAVTVAIIILLTYLYHQNKVPSIVYICIISGAMGNLYDRMAYNGVRDFISLGVGPVFNIADILLTIGVVMYIYVYMQGNIMKSGE